MVHSLACVLALMICLQAYTPPSTFTGSDCLTDKERKDLSGQSNVDGRVKVYRRISERLHLAIEADAKKQTYDGISTLVNCWKELLTVSLRDIEANINRKKKSGALIDYEIQLRKSIVDMKDVRLKMPYPQQDDLEAWMAQAEAARKKTVDILFQRESQKK
jgi:hypothetical protein